LIPIQHPSIQFDCGSAESVSTKPSKHPNGSNPNFLETMRLSVKVPENRLFTLPINIRVKDDRLIQHPIIGTRSIAITPYIPWTDVSPSYHELDEHLPKPVNEIPGASSSEPAQSQQQDAIIPIEEDSQWLNVAQQHKDIKGVKDQLIQNLDQRTLPEVHETFLEESNDDEVEDYARKRETVKNELELHLDPPTFGTFVLYRAKRKHDVPIRFEIGKFKGRFRLLEKGKENQGDPPLDLLSLYKPRDLMVRIYAIEGYQLVAKDRDGKNSPYIRCDNGLKKIKSADERKQDTSRPQFYKCYELPTSFPTATMLEVGIWDYKSIGKDELIGQTRIDLENRFFSKQWNQMTFKSIEYRTLWNPSSTNPQGQLKIWIDIMTMEEASKNPPENISPPLPLEYELRVIVWEASNVAFKDKHMSDIFVSGYPEKQKPQLTDTHWRSEDGHGSWNWRMKFPIIIPCPIPRFKLQVWDRDILKPNDAICEANINLRPLYTRAYRNKSLREILDHQWISMTHPSAIGIQGKVLVTFELLSKDEADRKPAGFGRSAPNDNPVLEKPNRPETSFNPLRLDKMVSKVIIGQHKGKIAAVCGCIVVVIILIIVLYVASIFR